MCCCIEMLFERIQNVPPPPWRMGNGKCFSWFIEFSGFDRNRNTCRLSWHCIAIHALDGQETHFSSPPAATAATLHTPSCRSSENAMSVHDKRFSHFLLINVPFIRWHFLLPALSFHSVPFHSIAHHPYILYYTLAWCASFLTFSNIAKFEQSLKYCKIFWRKKNKSL